MADFVKGLFVKAPRDNAPDFVKGSIVIKVDDLRSYLNEFCEDWINLDIKVSREGKWYCQINDWKPKGSDKPQSRTLDTGYDDFSDDIPFR